MAAINISVQENEAAVACTKQVNCTKTMVVVVVQKINVQFAFWSPNIGCEAKYAIRYLAYVFEGILYYIFIYARHIERVNLTKSLYFHKFCMLGSF